MTMLTTQPPDDWQPAGGEVLKLTRHMRGRKTRRQFLQTGAGVVGGLLAVAGGWLVLRPATREGGQNFGGISCDVAMSRAEALTAGGTLPESEVNQLREHVRLCPNCGPRLGPMLGPKLSAKTIPQCHRSAMA